MRTGTAIEPASAAPLIGEVLGPSNTVDFVGALHPLKSELSFLEMPEGLSIAEMMEIAQPDPVLLQDASVFVGDALIPRKMWRHVRPRAGAKITARVHTRLMGGGGGGQKNPLRTILTLAITAASFAFAAPLGAALLGLTEATALSTALGGLIITGVGGLLVNALVPVQQPKLASLSGNAEEESPSLFIDGTTNQLRPFSPIPNPLGFYRWRPPLAARTYTESLGDVNRLRMLLLLGYGEQTFTEADIKIGNTALTEFSDYRIEIRNGTDSDDPITIFPAIVAQESFAIGLTEAASWQVRTTAADADEISVDIAFPRGLVNFTSGGSRETASVVIEIEWSPTGANTWSALTPSDVTFTFDGAALSGSEITFTHKRAVAIRHGIRWKTNSRAQYDVRIRRTTADQAEGANVFDDTQWGALRTFTNEDPTANFPAPMALIALDFLATGQINGAIQDLSVYTQRVTLDYDADGDEWISLETQNPASIFRHVLQDPANPRAVPDSEIDIDQLEIWHAFCKARGFAYNKVHDYASSVDDVLRAVAAAGRAAVDFVDGKWSVIIDEAQSTVVTHITPRNSRGFAVEKSFVRQPHAWRCRFPNEAADYAQDEILVPLPGYTLQTATAYEALELPGATSANAVYKLARYHGAIVQTRAEQWSFTQDFEHLVARRGSLIRITHDVLLVGQASGRIKALTTDGGGDVTAITVDEELSFVSGTAYGFVIRRDTTGDVSISARAANLSTGAYTTVTLQTAIPAASAPEVGDLFGFGEFGSETELALVKSIEPAGDFDARLTVVPYRDAPYAVDGEDIPTYTPTVTENAFLPAAVVNDVVTDESTLELGPAGTTLVRAVFNVNPIGRADAFLEVQQRASSTETYYPSAIVRRSSNMISIGSVATGETWSFRVRWNSSAALPGPWTPVSNVRIVGKSTPPSALSGLNIAVLGGQALLRWSPPQELDVLFGGIVEFRHSEEASPSWATSQSIGQAAQARTLQAVLPLKPGTYFARVFDDAGNRSDVAFVNTKQASVLAFANVDTITEHPTFAGSGTSVTVTDDPVLTLAHTGLFDDIEDFDALPSLDYYGDVAASGEYEFASGFDFGSVTRVRLTTQVKSISINENDLIDDRTENIDDWEDFDGADQASADIIIFERHTDDDPAGSPSWSEWQRIDSAEFEARGFEFKALLQTTDLAYNIQVSELGVVAEELA